MKLINEAEVYSTWSPIIESATGIADKSKLGWMSEYCHYHKLYEDAHNQVHLNPAMNVPGMGHALTPTVATSQTNFSSATQGSGDKPFSLLPLALQVAGQTVGLDLVPVVPMSGPMGILTYLDFVYAGGHDPVQLANSQTGADGAALPEVFKLSASDSLTKVENYYYVIGDHGTAGSVTKGLLVQYIGTSRVDGASIFAIPRFKDGDIGSFVIASSAVTGDISHEAAAVTVVGNALGYTLANFLDGGAGLYHPEGTQSEIAAELAKRLKGGGVDVTTFDLTGGQVADLGDLTQTAVLVKALEDHITGFSGNSYSTNDPMRRGTAEAKQDNLLGLSLFNKSVAAETFQVAAAVTREQVQDLKQFGIDAVAQIESVLVNELTQSINKNIIDRLFALGAKNANVIETVEGVNFSFQLGNNTIATGDSTWTHTDSDGNTATLNVDAIDVSGGGNTQGTLQRRILSKFLAAANIIATRGRRGAANFVVTNGQVGTALQDVAGFVAYPMANTINQTAGSLYPVGSVAGLQVYVDPNLAWNNTKYCVGRKGDGNSPGLVFMPYLMAESVQTIAEGTMAPKIAVKSRYALVDAGHNPQLYYVTGKIFTDSGYSLV
mgnify:FL=1|tara:strand:+ start:3122 stop:4942 length:1821 start_codon:yes stop_codon:yes gene_type:complete